VIPQSDEEEGDVAKDEPMRLSSFLKTLGDELRAAAATAVAEEGGPILDIAECELELGLSWEAQGTAGANFYVFKLGGGGQRTQTQTIRLRLTPSEPPERTAAGGAALETPGYPSMANRGRGIPVVKTKKGPQL